MNSINPITPRIDTVIVLQGDDDEHLRHLKAEVERIEKAKPRKNNLPRTLNEVDETEGWETERQEAIRAHDEFAAEAEKRGVKVVLRALGRKAWRQLIDKHPPREGNDSDETMGVNVTALEEELVPLCMASPAGTDAEREAFLDSLNEGQYGDLAQRAYWLNMGRTADPTLRLSSGDSRTLNATSS